jgi:hypothetical protein
MERLAEKMKRSRAPEASITKKVAERDAGREQTTDRPGDQRDKAHNDRGQSNTHERSAGHQPEPGSGPVDIQDANPADIELNVLDLGDMQLAYSNGLSDVQAHSRLLTGRRDGRQEVTGQKSSRFKLSKVPVSGP